MKYDYYNHLNEKIQSSAMDLTDKIKVLAIATIYQYRFSQKYYFPGEHHNMYEFFYVIEGDMKTVLENNTVYLSQGEFIIVPPMAKHSMLPNKTYTHSISLNFIAEGIDDELICSKVATLGKTEINRLNSILKIYLENINEDPTCKLLLPPKKTVYGFKQLIKNEIENLLIEITQDFNKKVTTDNKPIKKDALTIAEKIKNYIDEHYTDKIQLTELSNIFHYSSSHLCRAFKSKYCETIISYTLRKKIIEAAKLISQEKKTFQEISDELGFNTVQYFSTVFKKYTHMTPTEFKKSVSKSHIFNSAFSITQIDFE